ncbi:MAG TPA: ATP-binding protein [Rhizomicrobium sp.]|nr:ATP-binding protein [Rhizomicrobium sp.]
MGTRTGVPDVTGEGDTPWRSLGTDVSWEAGEGGVIRCRAVFNRRTDIFEAVEGLNLRDIRCDGRTESVLDLLRDGCLIRNAGVRLPRHFGPDRLYMTGRRLPGGNTIGIFYAVEQRLDESIRGQVSLLTQISQARSREECYRREAEVMLQGLRLLLGENTTAEKLEALGQLLAGAIKSIANIVLRIGRDGVPRALGGAELAPFGRSAVMALWMERNSAVCVHGENSPHARGLHMLLDVPAGDVALISLPIASESILLICGAGRAGAFAPEDVGFASRFALILRQAAALKEEQDKLVQSAKLSVLGQMSASLAHELRQPLNTISMAAQNLELMAEANGVPRDVLKTKVARILGQVDRASQIIDRVRRFSRKGNDAFAPADLVALAQGVRVLTEHLLQASGVRLDVQIAEGLLVCCDAVQIEQVLANLVRNAVDALTGVGSAGVTENGAVWVRGWKSAHGVVLRVEDNGPGFPAHVLDRPVEAFFTTKDADSGTGLGLSICHTIAREHAGKLVFGNHAGGAYVELHLPERA